MRVAGLSALALVAACGGGTSYSSDASSWTRVYGSYEFAADVPGDPPVSVKGTIRLADGRYHLESNQGVCDEPLPLAPGTALSMSCPPLVLTLRRRGDAFEGEGTITLTVRKAAQQQVCRLGNDGRQVCGSEQESREARRQGRATIVRLSDPGAGT